MPFSVNDFPKNGGLSNKLSQLFDRDIRIVSVEPIEDFQKLKAISDAGDVFFVYSLDENFNDYFKKLEQATKKEAIARYMPKQFGCVAVLEIKDGKFNDYNSGTPIIVEEQARGRTFKQSLDNFSDSEKFDHELKERLFGPMKLIAEFREIRPEKYTPFVDDFTYEFMSLITKLENDTNVTDMSEARRAFGKWLPAIRKRHLSVIHGNFLPENLIESGDEFKLFNHSGFLHGDISLDVAGLIFGIIESSYTTYGRIKEPYITAVSLLIQSCNDNGIKEITKVLIPYISYFAFKECLKLNHGSHFFNMARNILNEDEFDINEINFLMELEFETEKHEAED